MEKVSGLFAVALAHAILNFMPRPPRADEAGGLYHAFNRGNPRATIFQKEGDYLAFERFLAEGLDRYRVELFSY